MFAENVDSAENFLHPESYDELLWADENLTESKKCAWYITTFLVMERAIEHNQQVYQSYRDMAVNPS